MDFADGTSFTISIKTDLTIEAKSIRDDGGQPEVLKDYTAFAIPH